MRRSWAAGLACALGVFAQVRASSADSGRGSAAAEMTRQGEDYAVRGEDAMALRRFTEALTLDPRYGPAYLGVGKVRERDLDWREALATYEVALLHVPRFVEALRGRARVLAQLGEEERAARDVEGAARLAGDPAILGDLAERYVQKGAWVAALAVWRKMEVAWEERGDETELRDARAKVRALSRLCGELDSVRRGDAGDDSTRRSLAAIARRLGY